ncbi:hydrolase [Kineosporia sp. J2-2]|uniref:Hydrolase n=1 Tax=Kineosporia corallincola TaxID=2835133 RepID=A0ABS5TRK6_9ACTN|nr:hydrolase [Kineosporia corallincola]MBT0773432.1 hydrolase [Kineosporia corallincola]
MSVDPSVSVAPPAPADPLAGARQAAAVAARHAQEADAGRRLHPEVVEALDTAGFGAWLVPRRWGGVGGSYAGLTSAVATVGEECASAAWIASLLAYTGRFGGFLPTQGQAELWAEGPSTRVVSSLVSRDAVVRAEPGGWNLSGTWNYTSGIEYSQWAFVAATVQTGEGTHDRFFLVPRSAYRIEESWFTVGMRATGSHTLVLEGVSVPEHRSFPLSDLFQGRRATVDDDRSGLPLFAVNGLTFSAPVIGAARGALLHGGRNLAGGQNRRLAPSDAQRIAFARSAGEIDAAGLLLDRIAAGLDAADERAPQVVRGSRDASLAVDLSVRAVDQLFRAGGTRAQSEGDPLNRIWRDVNSAASHFVLQFEPAALGWAKEELAQH